MVNNPDYGSLWSSLRIFWRILHHRSCYLISSLLSDFSYFILLFCVLTLKPSPLVYCTNTGKFLSLALFEMLCMTRLCSVTHPTPPLPFPLEDDLNKALLDEQRSHSIFLVHAEYRTNDFLSFYKNTPLEVRNDIKRSLKDVSTRIQKSPAVRNDKRRIVIVKNDNV